MMSERYRKLIIVVFLMLSILITGSIEHITIPLILSQMASLYFVTLLSTFSGCLYYLIILLSVSKFRLSKPRQYRLIFASAVCNSMITVCFIYSASPMRTPVVIQTIFLGLTIIPSSLLTKFYLKKPVEYRAVFLVLSLSLLAVSVVLSIIPLIMDTEHSSGENGVSWWIAGYLCGVLFLSFDNILQEKYAMVTDDLNIKNRLSFAFYSSLTQLAILLCLFWIDPILGYTDDSFGAFIESAKFVFTSAAHFFTIESIFIDFVILYVMSICLNSISANYNMILTNLTNQSIAIFYLIFPALNHGIKHKWYFAVPSLVCNIVSVVLWMKCEQGVWKRDTHHQNLTTNSEKTPLDQEEISSNATLPGEV